LITHGSRLRYLESEALTWRDLWVIVRHLPQSSALHQAIHGVDESLWTIGDYLLAQIADTQAWLAWTKTKDGEKGRNQPKPIVRPGVVDDSKKQVGSGALPASEMLDWLGWSEE
jgi:hypothetical protein